jgi:thioredoxin 1
MKGNATSIIVVIGVAVVVAGAVWVKTQRAQNSSEGQPQGVSTTTERQITAASAPVARESEATAQARTAEEPSPVEVPAAATEKPADATPEPPMQPAADTKLPRLVDLGADKCIPCKKLAPILEQLREEYKGRLDVEFIDVWKDPNAGRPYQIRVIPTQILYDRQGNEVWRHEGFIPKEDLKTLFAEKVGVE